VDPVLYEMFVKSKVWERWKIEPYPY
jgi:hypothetical protein